MNDNSQSNGWVKVRPRRGTFVRYASQCAIIVRAGKAPCLYLTNKVMEHLGHPEFVDIFVRGNNVMICPAPRLEDGAFKANKAENASFPRVSCKSFIEDYDIQPGVYTASHSGNSIVFDRFQTPSKI